MGTAVQVQGSHPADQEETLPSLHITADSRWIEGLNANYKTTAASTEDAVSTSSPGAEKSPSRPRRNPGQRLAFLLIFNSIKHKNLYVC